MIVCRVFARPVLVLACLLALGRKDGCCAGFGFGGIGSGLSHDCVGGRGGRSAPGTREAKLRLLGLACGYF